MNLNKLLGLLGTTLGGGLVGAGIQRTYMFGNKLSSGLSKMMGKSSLRWDSTTWTLLIIGILVLAAGVWFTMKKK
jgi:LPXTG-motif cell wall-anchored protein